MTPKKDYAVVTQSVGRIARTFDEKQDAICFDYVDDIQFCQNQSSGERPITERQDAFYDKT